MTNRRPIGLQIAALCLGEFLLICGVWWGMRHQIKAVNRTVSEVSDLRDPSPFRVALMGHLGKIHVGLEGFLRSPDPTMEKQVAESRQDFDSLLPEFVKQNPKLFPQAAAEEIERTFGLFKESIDRTLEANTRRVERRETLAQNFARILYLIEHNLRPIIRKNQADGEERSEAILNIENQMRAWQQNLFQAWAQPTDAAKALTFENENRGETFLDLYWRLELLARERKVAREIRALWQTNSDLARETYVKESLVTQAQKMMDAERASVIATLNKLLPALPPAEMEAKKQSILNAMRLHLAAASFIGFLGVVSFAGAVVGIYRLAHRPALAPDGVYRPEPAPPEAILQMDLKGIITEWSPGAETLYGYGALEMLGKSIGDLFQSDSEITRLGHELQKSKRTVFDTVHKTKTGAPVSVRIEFRHISDASGHVTGIRLVCSRQ